MLAPLPDRGLQGLLQTAKEVVLGEVWVMERAKLFSQGSALHPGSRCLCLGPLVQQLALPKP